MKTFTLAEKAYIDDTEVEDEGIAEAMLDDNAIAQLPRYFTHTRSMTDGALDRARRWPVPPRVPLFLAQQQEDRFPRAAARSQGLRVQALRAAGAFCCFVL